MKKFSLILLLSTIVVAIIYMITVATVVNLRNNYEFVDVDSRTRQVFVNYLNKQCTFKGYVADREQARKTLETEFGVENYTYKEGNVKNGVGLSIIPLRYIKIDADADMEKYYRALAHEMCHIKYFTANEIYTQFMAFKGLYESDNPELKEAGLIFGVEILNGNYPTEYDCSQLIINYLVESGVKLNYKI